MSELDHERLEESRRRMGTSWSATRRARRRVVALGAAALATMWISAVVCWFLAPSLTAMWTTFALTGLGLLTYVYVYGVLAMATGGVVGLADAKLDERQRAERRRAYTYAHRGSTVMLMLMVVLTGLLPGGRDHVLSIPSAALFMLLMAALTTHFILPHLVAGWRAQDPPPDEDDGQDPQAAEDDSPEASPDGDDLQEAPPGEKQAPVERAQEA